MFAGAGEGPASIHFKRKFAETLPALNPTGSGIRSVAQRILTASVFLKKSLEREVVFEPRPAIQLDNKDLRRDRGHQPLASAFRGPPKIKFALYCAG